MNIGIRLVFLICFLCIPAAGQAQPEARYKQMLATSPELREADQSIHDTLDEAQKLLTAEDYAQIDKIQEYWIKNEFAGNVKAYRESGLSEVEAWAQEIGSHADILSRAVDVLDLRRKGKGVEGVYELTTREARQGLMLVRQVDSSYTVEILVSTGNPMEGIPACTFSGEGPLQTGKDKRIVAATEESEATLSVIFAGTTATVQSTAQADAQCEKNFTLAGSYKK